VCGVHHLHYFSEKTICNLLQSCNYQVVEAVRGETDLRSLYRGKQGNKDIKTIAYNFLLRLFFALARATKRQNKLIIFAKKEVL
jgi:hypothetical protein